MLVEAARREALPEIAVPREVVTVAALPLLGSGKTNYGEALRLAAEANQSTLGSGRANTPIEHLPVAAQDAEERHRMREYRRERYATDAEFRRRVLER